MKHRLLGVASKLEKNGAAPKIVVRFFVLLIIAIEESPEGRTPGQVAKPKASFWKTLKRYPDRLRKIADELERSISDPLLDPRRWLPILFGIPSDSHKANGPKGTLLEQVKRWQEARPEYDRRQRVNNLGNRFSSLPNDLYLYAEYLDRQLQELGRYRKRHLKKEDSLTHYTVALCEFLRITTEKPHYSNVAALLECAYHCTGKEKDISADYVRKLYLSKPEMRKLPEFAQ